MQKITVIGRLTKDAAIRESQSGKRFASFSVAVNAKVRGADKTSYYDVLWNGYYEKMIQYLTKGSAVVVVGDLDAGIEDGKDGIKRIRLNLFADSVQFMSLGSNSGTTATVATVATPVAAAPVAQPATPVQAPVHEQVSAPVAQPTVSVYSNGAAGPDDDLPF